MFRRFLLLVAAFLGGLAPSHAQTGGIRGDSAAVAAAEKLLEAMGGRDAWSQRSLVVKEVGYLRNGDVTQITIWRDFEAKTLRLERTTPTLNYVEWNGPDGGWSARNGVVSEYSAVDHAVEQQGLKQEPYSIYHRIARRDPALRMELREEGRMLAVFDRDERMLCWFNLDAQGRLFGWGNHYNGNLNQHFYGPLVDFGNVNLPRFGAASTGVFRFEYTAGNMSNEAVAAPVKPGN
jgi:hypothetical protein